jgi:hypothetical protein
MHESRGASNRLFLLALAAFAQPLLAQNQLWLKQLGTGADEGANATAADGSGGTYAVGFTSGSLGSPHAGNLDAWLARYDGAGNQQWIRQLGTNAADTAQACAANGSAGLFVCGSTGGALGGPAMGGDDVWLARYDAAGNLLWMRQLGTGSNEASFACQSDQSGGAYWGGWSVGSLGGPSAGGADAWLARYDANGNQLWKRQLGTAGDDYVYAAAPGSNAMYLCGMTTGSLFGSNAGAGDAWIARYDSAGNQNWVRQFGTSADDYSFGASSDGAGGLYLCGWTLGNLGGTNAGIFDGWLARFDSGGNQQWVRQLGSSSLDFAWACAPDGGGGAYVTGSTLGDLGGTNAGGDDVWLARYDGAGTSLGVQQFGTSAGDTGYGAAADGAGGVYLAGQTGGSLGGTSAGGSDVWLARFGSSGCQAPSTYCAALVSSSGCTPAMTSSGTPSIANPTGFMAGASNLEVGQNGLMFFGTTGQLSAPFFGGTLCVNPSLYRLLVANAGGSGPCTGSLGYSLLDFLDHPSGGSLVIAGQVVNCQVWTRDPPAPATVSLSNGLEFTACP